MSQFHVSPPAANHLKSVLSYDPPELTATACLEVLRCLGRAELRRPARVDGSLARLVDDELQRLWQTRSPSPERQAS